MEREDEGEKEKEEEEGEGDAAALLTDALIAEANSRDVDSPSRWPV